MDLMTLDSLVRFRDSDFYDRFLAKEPLAVDDAASDMSSHVQLSVGTSLATRKSFGPTGTREATAVQILQPQTGWVAQSLS